jgi:hypothetical protein
LERELKEAREKLARKDDGSLFDLKNDSADAIIATTLAHVTTHKAEAIAKGLLEGIKKKRARPAG